ncbi:sucrose transport protein SUC3 isoform X1 [Rhododendron vialii]|uniref:sucrose transport protein SUC3 isoform X1 n=1 Tax=Rhododendron vialii TaxID=182163 RepID=UPI00265E53D7|nr:sucrose transport protein SUC3 isoform X1 [Rhododendron vialii]
MDAVSIRVPYRSLRQDAAEEVELVAVGVDDYNHHHHQQQRSNNDNNGVEFGVKSTTRVSSNGEIQSSDPSSRSCPHPPEHHASLFTLILSCTVAAGVQFGWALQLSLLTPYIQTLGIEHAFSSFIWLCGPITGLVVQPCVGIWSDKCTSKYGRRRPFILVGSLMISAAVIIIGFSADIGYLLGDTKEHCRTFKGTRTRAAVVFIIGFWMLDLANNTVQGPARALLADLAGPDQRNSANAIFCSWMAVGNIFGFSAGASGNWHRWFPFLKSRACCEACGNLKAAFLVAVVFLALCTLVTLYFAKEVPLTPRQPHHLSDSAPLLEDPRQIVFDLSKSQPDTHVIDNALGNKSISTCETDRNSKNPGSEAEENKGASYIDSPGAVVVNLLTSLRHLPPAMHSVLIVMAFTWLSWFPFFLFDTDWMGREVYHGNPKGDVSEVEAYDQGVREGAFGLLLNSVVLGISSFLIEPMCQWMGARLVWAMSNFIVFACMAGTAIISLVSVREYSQGIQHVIGGNGAIKIASLVIFALLGFPLAITYSVPFSVTAELTADSGGGQGLAIGVLNLAIVIPQMIVSLGAGPWDALFGGGNIPAFVLASLCALVAGVIATLKLPNLSNSSFKSSGFHFG